MVRFGKMVGGLLIAATSMLWSQDRVITDSLYSPSISMVKQFTVLLPESSDTGKRFPVLFLLHGHDGGPFDWLKRTDIEEYVRPLPLIVVMPDGENSWYVNALGDSTRRFEDYIVQDLRREFMARYPIDTMRQAIAGLSMGGHGALLLGMKHPDVYRFAGSFSGAFMYPHQFLDTTLQAVRQGLGETIRRAYGTTYSEHSRWNDVFEAHKVWSPDTVPYFYLATGIQDAFTSFIRLHRELADEFRRRGIRYEYHETEGGHNWTYWDEEVRKMLGRMLEVLEDEPGH